MRDRFSNMTIVITAAAVSGVMSVSVTRTLSNLPSAIPPVYSCVPLGSTQPHLLKLRLWTAYRGWGRIGTGQHRPRPRIALASRLAAV